MPPLPVDIRTAVMDRRPPASMWDACSWLHMVGNELYVCRDTEAVVAMASQTIGFAVADEDRERLDRLVEHFGAGNRSAYLRATLKVMESLRRAERLRELQAGNHRRMAERGISTDDLPDLIHEAYKGSAG